MLKILNAVFMGVCAFFAFVNAVFKGFYAHFTLAKWLLRLVCTRKIYAKCDKFTLSQGQK